MDTSAALPRRPLAVGRLARRAAPPPGRWLAAALSCAMVAASAPRAGAQLDPWDDPSRILVVYNTNWPDGDGDGVGDSTEVAQYYAARRGVPADRLFGLPLTPSGINYAAGEWALFLSEMRDPLLAWLAAHGDDAVDTLLFCYGVPYRVDVPGSIPHSIDNALCVPYKITVGSSILLGSLKALNPYLEPSPHELPDKGHFDHAIYKFAFSSMYLHCRLDGLTAEHSKALVDRAIYGQAHITTAPGGYTGNGVVDSRFAVYDDAFLLAGYPFGYTNYDDGDRSMAYGKFFVSGSGFPLRWEPYETEVGEPGALFSDGSSAEFAAATLFYGGWYNYAKYQHGWEWKTGAFACDLNSNSAEGLRSPGTASFLCQAFQENLTCGAGVVWEPYLDGHNRPDVFLAYVLDGYTWAEASSLSDPGMRWMSLHVGDPLYALNLSGAVADAAAPAPFAWLAPDHDALELELPAVPAAAPGGDEVFRITQVSSGASPAVLPSPVVQPDDRRLQTVAVPPSGSADLTYVSVTSRDPAGNAGAGPLLHFVAGPAAPALAIVDADDLAVGPTEPLAFRFSFGAAGGLLQTITGFSMTATAPAFGVTDYPIDAFFIPLAANFLATRSIDQVNFTVSFPPGVWPAGPVTLNVLLEANGQQSSSSVTVSVSD